MPYDDDVELFYFNLQKKGRSLKCLATMKLFEFIKPHTRGVDKFEELHGKLRDLKSFIAEVLIILIRTTRENEGIVEQHCWKLGEKREERREW